MTPLKNIAQERWTLPPPAEHIHQIAAAVGVTAEVMTQDTAAWDEPNPLEARQAAIMAAFQEEPLSKSEALALIDELAEIQTQLGKDL